jgi:hypothetical protein
MNEEPSALLKFLGSARLAWANILGFLAVPGCFDVMATDPKLRSVLEYFSGRHWEWILFCLVWLICFWVYFFLISLVRWVVARFRRTAVRT